MKLSWNIIYFLARILNHPSPLHRQLRIQEEFGGDRQGMPVPSLRELHATDADARGPDARGQDARAPDTAGRDTADETIETAQTGSCRFSRCVLCALPVQGPARRGLANRVELRGNGDRADHVFLPRAWHRDRTAPGRPYLYLPRRCQGV